MQKSAQAIRRGELRAKRRGDALDKYLQEIAQMMRVESRLMRDLRKSEKADLHKFKALRAAGNIRKHEYSSRNHDEAMRKSDEKFNRLLEALRRKNGNGRN